MQIIDKYKSTHNLCDRTEQAWIHLSINMLAGTGRTVERRGGASGNPFFHPSAL